MNNDRNQIFAFRTTRDFTSKFDELANRLGFTRSEVARYCLKRFLTEVRTPETFQRVRQNMY